MTKKKEIEKNIKLPVKAKGPVTLGRTTFIDEIYKKTESQPSVGFKRDNFKQPTSSLQATTSPSGAFAEIHSQTNEIENSVTERLQEGNLSNLCEGEGETGEIKEPGSPSRVIPLLNSPDKESVARINIEATPFPQTEIPVVEILDKGSVVKPTSAKSVPPQPRNTLLEIPEGYWHVFDPMAQNQPNTQTTTLQYPIVDFTV